MVDPPVKHRDPLSDMKNCLSKYPKDTSGIHTFETIGKRFVLDIQTATPFEIDGLTWDILDLTGNLNGRQIIDRLKNRYPRDEILSVLSRLDTMHSEGELFTLNGAGKNSSVDIDTTPGVLILQVAHDCNLSCRYCYADSGTYRGRPLLMGREAGERAVDFLIDNSGEREVLKVSFFGGEPLLNFNLVRHLVRYARARERGKRFEFNITSNGVLLSEKVIRYLSDNDFSMIISFDGPEEVHGDMRVFPDGRSSHRVILENIRKTMAFPIWNRTTVRGTISNRHLDIATQIDYLFDQGFRRVSVEPAIDGPGNPYAIREEHISRLAQGYREFTRSYLGRIRNGGSSSFFHFFNILKLLESGIPKRDVCGAGTGYLAISSNGDIYPCHKLDGLEKWKMGDVFNGIREGTGKAWRKTRDVNSNEVCLKCWARYLCGGGCRAFNVLLSGELAKPSPLTCELKKIRLKNAIWLYSELGEEALGRLFNRHD